MSDPEQTALPAPGQFLVYQAEDGRVKIDVRLQGETAWLTQAHMAELFQTTVPNVNIHLRNIFAEGELQADSVIKEFLITAADGKNYQTKFYNLDVIISVGYRVKSLRGTQFRIWATQRLNCCYRVAASCTVLVAAGRLGAWPAAVQLPTNLHRIRASMTTR